MKTLNDIKNSEGKPKLNHFSDWAKFNITILVNYNVTCTIPSIKYTSSTGTGIPVPITHRITNGGKYTT